MVKAIVVSEKCPHCAHIKTFLEEKGLLEKVKLIDVSTDEGAKFADEHDIMAVPTCVVLKEDGTKVRACSDEEFEKLIEEGK